mmetsp:Transcript_61507/g.168945  ORF Transcript_61507/g.168945 Transcript_61507/m.168945 type:complete len:335 (-) Transcript_61507:168-1172(-)
MVSISAACTTNGLIAATLGGAGIGLTAVARAASTGELLPSSSFHKYGTPSMILTAAALARAYGSPVGRFFELQTSASILRLAVGGALVGAGSSFGKGCTSGNGIQGLAAMSPASFVFVLTFMACGAAAAALLGSSDAVLGAAAAATLPVDSGSDSIAYELFALAVTLAGGQYAAGKAGSKAGAAILGGAAFSTSLVLSSMPKPSRVLGFLDFTSERGWDPTLMFVMGGALLVAFPLYQALGLAVPTPKKSGAISKWASRPVDARTVLGGVLFGAGWGCAGMCPGPGMVTCGAAIASQSNPVAGLLAAGGVWTAAMFGTKSLVDLAQPKSPSRKE